MKYIMYKLLLESIIMIKILVEYYNVIVQKNFYPSQQLDILDVILDKGKDLIIGKLWTIQLIKADFQLIMRIFLGSRNVSMIE